MTQPRLDSVFSDSISAIYEARLVPMLFEPFATELAGRLPSNATSLLEIAAGTGAATRAIARQLPAVTIVASDLNSGMIRQAISAGTARPVEWCQADAMRLPFADTSFDVVVSQFGAMFFPNKPAAFAEARRTLRPGGRLVFTVWNRIEYSEFEDVVTTALAGMFPDDPPRFLARTPHGYADRAVIERDVLAGGFQQRPDIDVVTLDSRAASARAAAIAMCQGTPLRSEITARAPNGLEHATHIATDALARRFGNGPITGKMQALIVTATR